MAEITIIFIVILARLLVPFTILRWPLGGTVASILVDTVDNSVLRAYGFSSIGWGEYQRVDKFLDLYYLTFAVYVSSTLPERWPRKILSSLFFWRFAGVLLFEITGVRQVLLFAPNIFEHFFLGVYGAKKFTKLSLNSPQVWGALLVAAFVLKLPQEYVMHYLEFPWGLGNFTDGLKVLLGL